MSISRDWVNARVRALSRLKDHMIKGLVDSDLIDFLSEINTRECLFTTSSCSGRVAIISGKNIFNKKNSKIIKTWHDPNKCLKEICDTLKNNHEKELENLTWISLQPPILHIVVANEKTAEAITKCGDAAGFNRACYKKYRAGGFHVELAVSDKLTIIGGSCREALEACRTLSIYKERLINLENCLINITCD